MPKSQSLLKELFSTNEKALNFYLKYSPHGLLYLNNEKNVFADERLLILLKLDVSLNGKINLSNYLDSSSLKKLNKELQKTSDSLKSLELNWKLEAKEYKIKCKVLKIIEGGISLIGFTEIIETNQVYGEKYFSYIVQNATDGIVVYEDELLVYASPAYLEMMGDDLENLLGNGPEWAFGIIHPDDRPNVIEIFEEIYAKRINKKRYRFRAKKNNGDYIWREDFASFEFNDEGVISKSVVVAKEISHQVALEKEIVRKEAIYHNIFDNVQIGLVITNKDTTIIEVNDVACSIIGLPREVLNNQKINDPNWVIFDETFQELSLEERPVCITAATGKAVPPILMGYYKHDEPEKVKWVELSSAPLLTENGELDKIVCTFLDVTKKHEVETKMKSAYEDLRLYRQFIDSGTDGLQVLDKSGFMVFINAAASERLAIDKKQANKFHIIDFENKFKSQDDWDTHFAELKQRGKMTLEGEHTNKTTGKTFPVEITVRYAEINNREYAIASTRDIAERKKAEREIISQARFPMENPNPVMRINTKGKLLYINEAAESHLKEWDLQLHQPILHQVRELAKEVFVNKASLRKEVTICERTYSLSITFVEEQKYANIYLLDITEKIGIQKQLQFEKQRIDNIINGVKLGTWEWHMDKDYIDFNSHWANMIGYEKEEVNPGSLQIWSNIVHPEDLPKAEKAIAAHLKNETETYIAEFRMRHKKGYWVWILSRGKVISRDSSGNPLLFSGTHNDITLQKEQEEELRLFESIVKNTNDAVLISEINTDFPLESKIVFANEALCRLRGYKANELLGKSPAIMQGEKTDKETIENIERASKSLQSFDYEIINYKKNGEPFWAHLSVTPMLDKKDKYTHWIAIIRDITQQKEQDIKLIEAKNKAEAASVAKSEFLANMSHEIRTPLNSVIGFTELLMQTKLDSSQKDYMQSVNYSANALLDLINDILDFSKIEAGKLALNIERIDLYELLYQIVEMVKFKLNEKKIELLLHIGVDVPQFIYADAVRLRQILVNLMGNAVKFTESGEIEIAVVNLVENDKGNILPFKFEVRDTGIGISEEKQTSIFNAFDQEDTSTTRKYGGTGLGLSISNKLLSLMGTQLQLTSELGKGSSFYFDVTLKVEKKKSELKRTINNVKHLLLVDDNLKSQANIREILNSYQITIDVASNGIEALSKIQEKWHHYDAVLLDCKMPFMDGKEVAKLAKEELNLSKEQLPIIMMNAIVNEEECKSFCAAYHIKGVIHKPVIKAELLKSLSELTNEVTAEYEEYNKVENDETSTQFGGKSILIVDDNPINRKLANSMLKKLYHNIQLFEAESGEEALEIVRQHDLCLILMDVQMPNMSGYETTKAIRKIEKNERPIIVALTAGTVKGEKEKCLAAGMDDYLSKPVIMEKLEKTIRKWTNIVDDNSKPINQVLESTIKDFNYDTLLEKLNNDTKIIEELLDMVRQGILKEQALMINEIIEIPGKEKEIKSILHRIKGIGLNLCFEKLSITAGKLEQMFPDYNSEAAAELFDNLDEQYQMVERLILNMEYVKSKVH